MKCAQTNRPFNARYNSLSTRQSEDKRPKSLSQRQQGPPSRIVAEHDAAPSCSGWTAARARNVMGSFEFRLRTRQVIAAIRKSSKGISDFAAHRSTAGHEEVRECESRRALPDNRLFFDITTYLAPVSLVNRLWSGYDRFPVALGDQLKKCRWPSEPCKNSRFAIST